jgi:multidrug efflux system outer membrane protein
MRRAFALSSALSLAACMPAERPAPAASAITAPADWLDGGANTGIVDARWWQAFNDPNLTGLVEAALARNTDVLAATARIQEAEANIRLARSTLLPTLNASSGLGRSRSLGATGAATSTTIQPSLDASWQVDLFGRLSKLTDAARLQYRASQADRDAVALSIAAQVAQAYVGLLALDAQLTVSRETVTSRVEALRLAQDQARVGYISQYELTQAQSEYEAVEQAIPQLLLAIRAQENAIRTLTGDLPGPVSRAKSLALIAPPSVPATLPSDLLARRPDLASAAFAVAAADASLASDRRAFLPQVALSASLGQLLVNALDYDPVTVWSIGGSILAPIFQGGRLTAQVDVSTSLRDQAAFAYRGTVLTAFQEVETALTGVQRYDEQFRRVINRRNILVRSVTLATDRYRGGYAAYLEQLDAQRNLYSTELEAITVRQDQLNNIITLYRALGGGWSATSADTYTRMR